jgi:hypothetical protein
MLAKKLGFSIRKPETLVVDNYSYMSSQQDYLIDVIGWL